MVIINRIYINLLSVINLIILNIKIILLKKKRKNYFFYYPKTDLTKIHTFYIENFLKKFKDFTIIYGSPSYIKKNIS